MEFLKSNNISKLYHATFLDNLDSIKTHGLGADVEKKVVYEGLSRKNVTYLASSAEFASQFCEAIQEYSNNSSACQNIIVLEVDLSELDLDCLAIDPNHPTSVVSMITFTYSKVIPFSLLTLVDV